MNDLRLTTARARLTAFPRDPLGWILLAAALYRGLHFLQVRHDPTFTVPLWDAAAFDAMARSVAAGHGLGTSAAYHLGPLYPYVLGGVYALTGACQACAVVLQHALGVGLCALAYVLGRRWYGRGAGLLAALQAVSGPAVFYEGKLLMETLLAALLLGQLWLLERGGERGRRRDFLAAGLLLGLAAAGRPSLLALIPLAALPLRAAAAHATRRRTALLAAVYLAGALLAPVAATVRNLAVEGVLVPVTASGGYNFYIGNARHGGQDLLDRGWETADATWNGADTAEAAAGRPLDSAQVSRYWYGQAWRGIGRAPLAWLGVVLHKLQLFFSGRDVPQIEWYTWARGRSSVLGAVPDLSWPLMACAVAGLVAGLRRRGLLAGTVLVYGGVLAFYFVTSRYRVAVLPCLALLAAGFVVRLVAAARGGRRREALLLAALLLVAGAATAPARFPAHARRWTYAQLLHDGYRNMLAGRYPAAEAAYARAQETLPDDHESYLDLALVQQRTGELPAALASLAQAAARAPDDPEVPYQQGVVLHKLGREREAEAALRRSLQQNPRRALTLAYLGLVLAGQGRADEAQAAFDASLARDPDQAFTHANLGALLAMQGELPAAQEHLRRALVLDPANADARRNLAITYLDTGDAAAARRELLRLLEQKPDDTAARRLLESLP